MNKILFISVVALILGFQRATGTDSEQIAILDKERARLTDELQNADLSADELALVDAAFENAKAQAPESATFAANLAAIAEGAGGANALPPPPGEPENSQGEGAKPAGNESAGSGQSDSSESEGSEKSAGADTPEADK